MQYENYNNTRYVMMPVSEHTRYRENVRYNYKWGPLDHEESVSVIISNYW